MKKLIVIAIILMPILSQAGTAPTGAKAVMNSVEIASLLRIENRLQNLVCEPEVFSDVVIKPGADMDSFSVDYGCNDPKYGANYHRIHFSGGVYTHSPTSTHFELSE